MAPVAIFVSGIAGEGWAFTPLGPLFFRIGLGLIIFEAIQRKSKSKAA